MRSGVGVACVVGATACIGAFAALVGEVVCTTAGADVLVMSSDSSAMRMKRTVRLT